MPNCVVDLLDAKIKLIALFIKIHIYTKYLKVQRTLPCHN